MKSLAVAGLALVASTAVSRGDDTPDLVASARTAQLVDALTSHFGPYTTYSADYELVVTKFGPKSAVPFTEHGHVDVDATVGRYLWSWDTYRVASDGSSLWRMDDATHAYTKTQPCALLDGVVAFTDPIMFQDRYDVTSPSELQLVLTPRTPGTTVDRVVIDVDPTAHGHVTAVTVFDVTGATNEFDFSADLTGYATSASTTFEPRSVIRTYKNVTRQLPLPTTTSSRR